MDLKILMFLDICLSVHQRQKLQKNCLVLLYLQLTDSSDLVTRGSSSNADDIQLILDPREHSGD